MVLFNNDTNAILSTPMKSRSQEEIVRAQAFLHDLLTKRGFKPQTKIVDNECHNKLKEFFAKRKVHFQLVPPHLHRTNTAERAIATFKDHLVARLASTDPAFPLRLWCRLIHQVTTTLNLMRPSRINPKVSTEEMLNGAFDYDQTPLAPPGTRVIIHETPSVRKTWAPHSVDGWYIGGAPNHYRCHRCYVIKSRSERIARTVEFFPYLYSMPTTTSADAARDAAAQLTDALVNPYPAALFSPMAKQQLDALYQLAEIFARTMETEVTKTIPNAPETSRKDAHNGNPRRIPPPKATLMRLQGWH